LADLSYDSDRSLSHGPISDSWVWWDSRTVLRLFRCSPLNNNKVCASGSELKRDMADTWQR